jgi:hypothetical protein
MILSLDYTTPAGLLPRQAAADKKEAGKGIATASADDKSPEGTGVISDSMGSLGPSPQPRSIEAYIGYDRNLPVQKVAGTISRYRNGFDHVLTTVHDVRGQEHNYTLDIQGFQFVSPEEFSHDAHDYSDQEHIKSIVYTQTQDLLKNITGASRVHCYSHLVRHKLLSTIQAMCDDKSIPDTQLTKISVPSPTVHIDHSAKGSREVLVDNLGEAQAFAIMSSNKRWGIINLWRPLKTVRRDPLCVCDARSVNAERDLVNQVRPARSMRRDFNR